MNKIRITSVLCVAALAGTAAASEEEFQMCGTLMQGFECSIFQADSGQLYALDDPGDFEPGSQVCLTATLSTECPPFCDGLDGCLIKASLWERCRGDSTGDGIVDVGDLLQVIRTWGMEDPPPSVDFNQDGRVDSADLVEVIVNWGVCS